MTAFYNEIDPYAAQWLRNLIAAGHIAPGVVDERSIEDIIPEELYAYTQCHFFAGVGVWSLALRLAAWPDDRPIWTGSCPCQPFSAAGKGAGFADERHLWPAFYHLIAECRPAALLGEQVASAAVDPWIDLVHADLEALGYAFGSVPFPSAGVGAPHTRDRNYWVAHADSRAGRQGRTNVRGRADGGNAQPRTGLGSSGVLDRLADANGGNASTERQQCGGQQRQQPQNGGCGGMASFGLADTSGERRDGRAVRLWAGAGERAPGDVSEAGRGGALLGAGNPADASDVGSLHASAPVGPTNGFWRDADWLGCRDGKWRPVEPGTFPLAHGASARVGRLRAYGNAINAEAARAWIETVMVSL